MLVCALFCGTLLGGVYDALRMIRFRTGNENLTALPPRIAAIQEKTTLPVWLRFRLRKKEKPSPKKKNVTLTVVLFLQDVSFCLLFAVAAALLLYQTNDGQLRLSVIAVMLAGMGLYLLTVGRIVKRFWMLLTVIMRAVFCWTIALLIYPARLVWRWLARPRLWLIGRVLRFHARIQCRMAQRKQARMQRRQQKEKEIISEATARKLAGPRPDGKHVFVSGGRRTQK